MRLLVPMDLAAAIPGRNCAAFFEIDRHHVAVAALKALADEGTVPTKQVAEAIKKYEINTEAPNPWEV